MEPVKNSEPNQAPASSNSSTKSRGSSDLAEQQVSRKQFLAYSGAAFLSLVGIGSIIEALSGKKSIKPPPKQKGNYQLTSQKNKPNGYAGLDSGGKVPQALLPANTSTSPNLSSLSGVGDVNLTSPSSGQALTYDSNSNTWTNQTTPKAPVTSVFGRVGVVTAQSGDYTAAKVGALSSTDDLSAIASANPTSGNVSLNSNKITRLANGSQSQDAATFGQIPVPGTTAGTYAAGNDSRIAGALQASNDLSELTSTASTARANLGLGSASTQPSTAFSPTALPSGISGNGFYDPQANLYTPSGAVIPKTRAKLAQIAATAGRFKLACIGASQVAGWNGTTSLRGTGDWPTLLGNELAQLGFSESEPVFTICDAIAADSRENFTGSWSYSTHPSSEVFSAGFAGAAVTVTSTRVTNTADLVVSGNSGTFTVSIDGSTPTSGNVSVTNGSYSSGTVTPNGSTSAFCKVTVSNLATTAHTALVTSTGSGVALFWIDFYSSTEISIANFGSSSTQSAHWADTTTAYYTLLNEVLHWAPDVVIYNLGVSVNDFNSSVSSSTTLANFETTVAALQTAGIEVILQTPNPFISPVNGTPPTSLWQNFYSLADAKTCILLDSYTRWGSSEATALANGLIGGADTVHPSASGYMDIAQHLLTGIGAVRQPAVLTSARRTAQISSRMLPRITTQGTWVRAQLSTAYSGGYIANSASTAVNDSITYDVDLSAGTWSLTVAGIKGAATGVATFDISMDGGKSYISVGTQDYYAASGSVTLTDFTGIVIPSTGPGLFRIRMLSKNASSSNYEMFLSSVDFDRTDAA